MVRPSTSSSSSFSSAVADSASRSERTSALLAQARECSDPEERTRLLDEVVVVNMCVADAVVSRFRGRGVADDDLKQVAYLALTRVAHRFDPDKAEDFLSFAVPSMRGEIRKYFRDQGWMIRPVRRIQELQPRVTAAGDELWRELGRSPLPREVAERIGESEEDVVEALATYGCFRPASLDRPVGTEPGSVSLGDLLGSDDASGASVEARVMLREGVRTLSRRDRKILAMRFFDGLTQREIAEEIGVTQMQVSRLLSRIFRDLRRVIGEVDPDEELSEELNRRTAS